ncbi:MAG: hypothetical protein WDW38_000576 [Sanguina aurantia]
MSTANGQRRHHLALSRTALHALPCNTLFELPGAPARPAEAALGARSDIPFLFKAFETGQIGPKRLSKIHGGKPRMATIHEYLDWTVTAVQAEMDDELDFGGFRVIVVLPRYRCGWPAPGTAHTHEGVRPSLELGAPGNPLPRLEANSRPLSAATVRSGPGYLEVPFVATAETKRGRGYCRCLVEAIEDVARACKLATLMLCSTNDPAVKSTWHHLGFELTDPEHMTAWDILYTDLVHLQSTTQMHKHVPPPARYKPIVFRHGDLSQRTYALLGKRPQPSQPNPTAAPHPALSADPAASTGGGAGSTGLGTRADSRAVDHWRTPAGEGQSTQRLRRASSLFAGSSVGGVSAGPRSQGSVSSGSVHGKGKGVEGVGGCLLDTAGKAQTPASKSHPASEPLRQGRAGVGNGAAPAPPAVQHHRAGETQLAVLQHLHELHVYATTVKPPHPPPPQQQQQQQDLKPQHSHQPEQLVHCLQQQQQFLLHQHPHTQHQHGHQQPRLLEPQVTHAQQAAASLPTPSQTSGQSPPLHPHSHPLSNGNHTAGNGMQRAADVVGSSCPRPQLPAQHSCAAASGEVCKGSPCGSLQGADEWSRAKEQCVPPPFVTAYSSRPP